MKLKALVQKSTGSIVTVHAVEPVIIDVEKLEKSGLCAWVEVPNGEEVSDLFIVNDEQGMRFVVDAQQKQERLKKEAERQALIARIELYDEDLANGAERKQFMKDCRKALLVISKGSA